MEPTIGRKNRLLEEKNLSHLLEWLRSYWLLINQISLQVISESPKQLKTSYSTLNMKVWEYTIETIHAFVGLEQHEDSIDLGSDRLLGYLCSNILTSQKIHSYYDFTHSDDYIKRNEKLNPYRQFQFLFHLSHVILYIFHCFRYCPEYTIAKNIKKKPPFNDIPAYTLMHSLSDSLLFLLSEYAYREIGVPRELLVLEKLRRQLNFELPLYTTSNFYRDHLYHVMDVCLLGELLLKSFIHNNHPGFLEVVLPGKGRDIKLKAKWENQVKKHLLRNWYIAALCHDLGYVVEKIDKLVEPAQQLKSKSLSIFTKKLIEGIKTGKKDLQEKVREVANDEALEIPEDLKNQIVEKVEILDHGVIGWLYLYDIFKEMKAPLNESAPALKAILRHNLANHEQSIHQEPLSFLLLLCDHLQEWGRPIVATERLACRVMESLRFPDNSNHLEAKTRVNRLLIKGLKIATYHRDKMPKEECDGCIKKLCKNDHICRRINPRIDIRGLTFILSHQEAHEAEFEPVLSWLFFCRDFQRIDGQLMKLPFPIAIEFEHQQPRLREMMNWNITEMDIFEEYANNKEEGAYLCQWIEEAKTEKTEKNGITYKAVREKGDETFRIQLGDLGRPFPRGLDDKHWRDFARWKWDWLIKKYMGNHLGPWISEMD
jgi:hypothetical protein